MTTLGQRLALLLFMSSALLACAPRAAAPPPAPVNRPAIEQIPVDLDFVLRADLKRIRQSIDPGVADSVGRLLLGQARAPLELLAVALTRTDVLWLGLRPDSDPRRWDNVVILEGDFSAISTEQITAAFGPPRDLGGGFRAYDVLRPGARTAPARLYTYLEERWLLASLAEVDALERVIERHRRERTLEPPERGIIAFSANLSRVSASFAERSPKAAELVQSVESVTGFVSPKSSGFEAEMRAQLVDVDAAKRAALSIRVFLGLFGPRDVDVRVDSHERDLIVSAEVTPQALGRVLAPLARP